MSFWELNAIATNTPALVSIIRQLLMILSRSNKFRSNWLLKITNPAVGPTEMAFVCVTSDSITLSMEYMFMGVLYCLLTATGTDMLGSPPGENGAAARL